MHSRLAPIRAVLAVLALASCAGPSWEQIRAEDSPATYRQFLADHPNSKYAAEARERLAVLQIERAPTLEALERFRREYAESPALPALLKQVESGVFQSARKEATPSAYARFLEAFPDGALTARATANQIYLQAGGFAGRPDLLAAFVREHPESDYAAEAGRVLSGLESRQRGGFGRVSLEIEVAPDVPEASRLRGVFSERAREMYQASGIALVDGPDGAAVLKIRHTERSVAALEGGGDLLAKPGVLAETEVSLATPDGAAIFRDSFSVRIPDADRRRDGSALFAKSAASYWDRFYVPIATWPTSAALRSTWKAAAPLAGVGADVGRAIALAPDGSFREIDLSDPTSPRVIGHYPRPAPAGRFAGARRLADHIVLYGEDGIEVVTRSGGGYRRVAAWDRGVVGGVFGVEEVDGRLLAAGTRGLVRAPLDGGEVERLIEHPLRSIARSGGTLYVLDDQWVYGGPLSDLRAPAFFTVADVGRPLEPRVLRVGDGLAVVVGDRGLATFALSGTGAARALARPRTAAIGEVSDAAILGGSVFALGERGLLVIDPRTGRIVDSVDVDGRLAIGAAGRQLVTIGGDQLDVVDATPWTSGSAGAAALAR
jgi:hypothetical protein